MKILMMYKITLQHSNYFSYLFYNPFINVVSIYYFPIIGIIQSIFHTSLSIFYF